MLSQNTCAAAEPGKLSVEVLEAELTTLAGHLNAGNYRFLRLLAEFERRQGYSGFGIVSCAHWLSWKCGIGLVAAREKVRVARAIEELPLISEAMRLGKLSYCKARAITRVATVANESLLLSLAENGTVSHLEKSVRLFQRGERVQELKAANTQYEDRYAQCYFDEHGELVLRAQLPPEQGALFMKALQLAADSLREAERASCETSRASLQADALGLMAETLLACGPSATAAGDRHLVTVHVAEEVLRDPSAAGEYQVEEQSTLPPATVRRLCCDGSLVAVVEGADGAPQQVSRKTRAVPSAMRRALEVRDGGCRFPGCNNRRFVDAHHIVHWADGGDTTLDNLTLLCRKHHRFLHEHDFHIERADGALRFLRPDGMHIPDVPRLQECESERGCDALLDTQSSFAIEPATAVCSWNGQHPQYSWIVGLLQERSPRRHRASRPALHMNRGMAAEYDYVLESDADDAETQQMLRDQQLSAERSARMLS